MIPQLVRAPIAKTVDAGSVALRYPGGKGGAGVYQTIINLMPAHRVYIEPFVGGGNIYLRKKPAEHSIIIDSDDRSLSKLCAHGIFPSTTVICGDAGQFIENYPWQGDELVYCDPPYVMSARSGRRIYRHEFTDRQHQDLVSLLLTLPAAVMLSGYRNAIYDERIPHWWRTDFRAMTRGGPRIESLWTNFNPPAVPAELTYVGANYRERERIKRKKARWAARLAKLPAAERAAILEILLDQTVAGDDGSKPAAVPADYPEFGNGVAKGDLFQGLKSVPIAIGFIAAYGFMAWMAQP